MIQQRLFNTDEDPQNRSYIDSDATIPISTCKFVKNRSYINSGASIPTITYKSTRLGHSKVIIAEAYEELINNQSCYSKNDQLFKVDVI